MKSVITSLLIGGVVARSVLEQRQVKASGGGGNNGIAALVGGVLNRGYGKVADPAGAAPRRIKLATRAKSIPGSESVKIRYGPYNVPNMNHKNIMGEAGMLWNYPDKQVEKPCQECVIVGMNAGLEYPNGRSANIDNNQWLHHFVQFVIGPGRVDATCGDNPQSLPHMLIGSTSKGSERFFSSGNERTPAFLQDWSGTTNVGYHLRKEDKMAFIVDLMNENMKDELVYLTISYDYVPGRPAGFDDMKPVWFDAAQCGTSEVKAPKQSGNFTVTAPKWVANFEGDILGSAGHLHDGGTNILLVVDGKTVCNSDATYGGSPEYVQKNPMMHKDSAVEHISKMKVCMNESFTLKKLVKGQVWTLKAVYDYSKQKGMLHEDGKQSSVMGIAIMYVRVKK
ncbi:Diphthamide biosynthesis protein 2 [Venturia nashicola]|uniref:Diphthamide biosynthesis protein 2 n=1 Tax=Venturia nashicola TaxID=86259 RepID=A0A4Z1PEL2_9PEZI|nr:Diphthamide biosynthesis protein 2 [Venturia nashicola]